MKVFLTGGTGLLGQNICRELQNQGYSVSALVRSIDAGRKRLGEDVDLVLGDLKSSDTYHERIHGAEILIHAAACYGEYYRAGDKKLPLTTNVDGTHALLEAAVKQGVKNIVYVSSSAVLKGQTQGPTNELSPYPESLDDPYFMSKIDAERTVLRFLEEHSNIRGVLILPTVMLGPGDYGPTPTGAFILKLLQGKLKFILPGSHRIADVRDVALAAVKAIHQGQSGERYLIGGRKIPISEIYKTLSEVSGVATPTKTISPKKLMFAAHMMTMISKVTRKPPPLKPEVIRRLQAPFYYCSEKAEKELDVKFRPFTETLADTVDWFRQEKMA